MKNLLAHAVGGDLVMPSGSVETPGGHLYRLANARRPNLRQCITKQAHQVLQCDIFHREIIQRRRGSAQARSSEPAPGRPPLLGIACCSRDVLLRRRLLRTPLKAKSLERSPEQEGPRSIGWGRPASPDCICI
eukprot:5090229-Alexandrium_andersonii.AAC.1